MVGFDPPGRVYIHVCGTDIIRHPSGRFIVLEDNARTPSGVSYVIENRHMMRRCMPDLLANLDLRPVDEYGSRLRQTLCDVAPEGIENPQVVLLSPGTYNSAYFEHVFLAREMGVPLVEGRDLVVREDNCVYMKTIAGLKRLHSIYRRIDDAFLDPEAFNPEAMPGVPGCAGGVVGWARVWRQAPAGSRLAMPPGQETMCERVAAGNADSCTAWLFRPDVAA